MNRKEDRAFQEAVVGRDGTCLIGKWDPFIARNNGCMGSEGISGHHIIRRGMLHTRHNPKIGVALCVPCHKWAEDNKRKSRQLFIDILIWEGILHDEDEFYELLREANKANKHARVAGE